MAALMEVARQTHEESERYSQALSDLLSLPPTASHRDNLKRALRASILADRVVERNAFLSNFYSDVQGERRTEIESLSIDSAGDTFEEGGIAQGDGLAIFYNRLEQLKDHHRRYPSAAPDSFSIDYTALDASISGVDGLAVTSAHSELDVIDRIFSGEESGGRFLDLYLQHESFLNLKGVRKISYLQYIDELDHLTGAHSRVSEEIRRTEPYRKYTANLKAYLDSYLRKTRPLEDIDAQENEAMQSASAQDLSEVLNVGTTEINTSSRSVEGVWCEVCSRSFAKQSVFDGHLSGAKHKKAALRASSVLDPSSPSPALKGAESDRLRLEVRAREVLVNEAVIRAFGSALSEQRAQTRSNVERKAVLTERERQSEAEAAAAEGGADGENARQVAEAADDEDEDGKIYNPLKLPLGWDGKPIPFWLYKLHGLGVEYKCEICSDHIYQGRKNFERHFQESRHAFGMRALNLPNTRHFHEITRIEDALSLAEKLKRQGRLAAEEEGDAEEVEDDNGNTYTRKTFDLLKRQGLL